MKTVEKLISAAQCRRSAQIFIIGSIIAVLVPPLLMVWIAASIFAYASVAHHPDMRVREYQRWAGYRFYGLVGTLVVVLNFSGEMKDLAGWRNEFAVHGVGLEFIGGSAVGDPGFDQDPAAKIGRI